MNSPHFGTIFALVLDRPAHDFTMAIVGMASRRCSIHRKMGLGLTTRDATFSRFPRKIPPTFLAL